MKIRWHGHSCFEIILNDGTVIENGRAGYSQGVLCCFFTGYTMPQAGELFFNPSKTERIVFQYGEMETIHEGFTNCVNIGIDIDGRVSVSMEKGVV